MLLLAAWGGDAPPAQTPPPPFSPLSADPSLNWMGRAFSEVVAAGLEGSPQRHVISWSNLHSLDGALGQRPAAAPGISAERGEALLSGAQGVIYGDFSVVNGRLRATAMEEDVASHQMIHVVSASGPPSAILPVAASLARQLGATQAFDTRNPQALRDYADALDAADPADAFRDFAQAAQADPDFGRAYVFWIDAALEHANRAEAERVLQQAEPHLPRFSALDRARLNFGAAILSGSFPARLQAVTALAGLDPQDPNTHRALAGMLLSVRRYDEAITEFRRTLALRPDDLLALNSMGYAAAYHGDLPTAIRVLRGYEQLRPNEPNPLDSLGDAHFALGHFSEAEQFYLAAAAQAADFLNGGEFLKAAQARLMTGDIPGATTIFHRYLAQRRSAGDPAVEYYAAAWSWQTGARRAAVQRVEELLRAGGTPPEIAAPAHTQAAIWLLELGDRTGAAQHARQALAEASPASAGAASVVGFLADPQAFPAPSQAPMSDYAHAYSLLFARNFQSAITPLQQIYQRPTTDLDDGLAVLLAWAYLETGQWQTATPLLRLNPLPQTSGLPMLASLYFPRLFYLRGAVLQKAGQRQQAARNYRLFLSLSGADNLIWGDQQRARTALDQLGS
jgi:tetratricopeptide (TPR) repeat protein